jgi:hypothetical protein
MLDALDHPPFFHDYVSRLLNEIVLTKQTIACFVTCWNPIKHAPMFKCMMLQSRSFTVSKGQPQVEGLLLLLMSSSLTSVSTMIVAWEPAHVVYELMLVYDHTLMLIADDEGFLDRPLSLKRVFWTGPSASRGFFNTRTALLPARPRYSCCNRGLPRGRGTKRECKDGFSWFSP